MDFILAEGTENVVTGHRPVIQWTITLNQFKKDLTVTYMHTYSPILRIVVNASQVYGRIVHGNLDRLCGTENVGFLKQCSQSAACHVSPTFSMRKLFPPFDHMSAFGALPCRYSLVHV